MRHLHSSRSVVAGLATMLVAASLTGCMEFLDLAAPAATEAAVAQPPPGGGPPAEPPPRSATTSVTVRVAGPLTVASAKGGHDDIDSVTVSVAGNDAEGTPQDPLATATLTRSPAGVWTGNLSGLTINTELTFTAKALDGNGTEIFSGTHTATLTDVGAQITIRLQVVDDNVANRFPKVTGISISNVSTGIAADLTITVQGSASEQLDYELTGGAFDPSAGSVTLEQSGTGSIAALYRPPDIVGWYTVQVAVRNAQGNRAEVDFQMRVQTWGLTARLGPVVRGISGKRTPAGIRWTAAVSAAGDGTGLTYAWAFTKDDNSAGTFTDAAENPTIMTGYEQTTAGTLSVTVTDADGLETSASLAVAANMFPALPLMPQAATLLVNEIDYDQAGSTDSAEFIEILNPGSGSVDLADYRFELVDGADDEPYQFVDGSGQLPGGGFLVLAKQSLIDTPSFLPAGTLTLALTGNSVTNGPDGVRIVRQADSRVVDAVHYEGVVPGAGEGSPAPQDPDTDTTSIGRCPAGFDSDDNGLDFRAMPATPGAANTCS
ncbi:MAG: lamin tail domain-containing protein [Spirochaetaceae bacterium]|nr:lamin tail domain-containing protein [Spirochaetaceae bacterium]